MRLYEFAGRRGVSQLTDRACILVGIQVDETWGRVVREHGEGGIERLGQLLFHLVSRLYERTSIIVTPT